MIFHLWQTSETRSKTRYFSTVSFNTGWIEFSVIILLILPLLFSSLQYDWTSSNNQRIFLASFIGLLIGFTNRFLKEKDIFQLFNVYSWTTIFWVVFSVIYVIHLVNNPVPFWDGGSEWSLHIRPDKEIVATVALVFIIWLILIHSARTNRRYDVEISCALLLFFLYTFFQVTMLRWGYDAFLLYPLIIVAGLQIYLQRENVKISSDSLLLFIPITIFLIIAALSTIISVNRFASLLQLVKLISAVAYFLVIIKSFNLTSVIFLLRVFFLLSLLLFVLFVYKFCSIWWHLGFSDAIKYRYIISGGTHTRLAKTVAQGIIICMGFAIISKRRVWWILFAILLSPFMVFTYSISAITALGAAFFFWGIMIFFLTQNGRRIKDKFVLRKHLWISLIGCALIIIVGVGIMVKPKMEQIILKQGSDVTRLLLWQRNLNIVQNYPWLGIGLVENARKFDFTGAFLPEVRSAYDFTIRRTETDYWSGFNQTPGHNMYSDIAVQMGLPGLGTAIWLTGAIFILAIKVTNKSTNVDTKVISITIVSCIAVILVHNQTQPEWQWMLFPIEVFIYLGALLAITKPQSFSGHSVAIFEKSTSSKYAFLNSVLFVISILLCIYFISIITLYRYTVSDVPKYRLDKKISNLSMIAQLMPSNPRVYADKANLLEQKLKRNQNTDLLQYANIIALYKTALALDPSNVNYNQELGLIFCKIGLYNECNQQMRLAAKYKVSAYLYGMVGRTFLLLGDFDGAVDAFVMSVRINPFILNNSDVWSGIENNLKNDVLQAISTNLANQVLLLENTDIVEAAARMNILSKVFVAQGDYDAAINITNQIKKMIPEQAYVYQSLGQIYYQQKNYRAAIVEFKNAIKIEPLPVSYYYLGLTYEALGDYKQAIKNIKLAQKEYVWLRYLDTYSILARLYQKQGNLTLAIQALEKDLFLQSNETSFETLTKLYCDQDKYSCIGRIGRLANDQRADAAWPHLELGQLYLQQAMSNAPN